MCSSCEVLCQCRLGCWFWGWRSVEYGFGLGIVYEVDSDVGDGGAEGFEWKVGV